MFWAVLLSAFFAPLVFLGNLKLIILGVLLWGVGMGAQESIMRAAIALMVPKDKRGSGYGVFNTFFGVFWFAGSALMGWLYDLHVIYLVAFSMVAQFAALPIFLKIKAKS